MPRIPEETINDIRNQADIVEIIKEYIPLTPRGKNYFGVCPFHQDHSPSMSVSKEKQMYKCFSCGAGGNVFKFVSDYENISYLEAVERVASKVGINIQLSKEYKPKEKYEKEYQTMDLAKLFFQNNINTEEGKEAKQYLITRGLDENALKDFDIGLSFDKNSFLQFCEQKKIKKEDLLNLGLINQNGLEYSDVFINRILFPIHDPLGHVVGFTGRVYKNDIKPKYLNSKETPIFRKGNILFNYHRAKASIREAKEVILVEGNMDAIRMYINGFKNTIALMGTSLTKDQIVLLQKLRVPIILMFDNDEAGKLATITNGKLLSDAGIEIKVVRLSGEKDPDEYIIAHGYEAMADNIKHPLSYLEFQYNVLKENKNLNDAEDLREYTKSVLDTLRDADPLTIDITLNKLVQEFHLSYDVLKESLPTPQELTPIKIAEPVKKPPKQNRYDTSANHILYFMMNDIKYVKVYQSKLGYFKDELYRAIANEIIYYTDKHKKIELADFLTYIEESPLKDHIYEVIKSIKDSIIDETSMEDYIFNIKQIIWEDELKKLKEKQKQTNDIHEKEKIGLQKTDIMKKIQLLKEERSVKK